MITNTNFSKYLSPVLALDWDQAEEANQVSKAALSRIRESDGLIEYLVRNILKNLAYFDKCQKRLQY